MAFRRSLVVRVKLYSHQRFSPSSAYIHHDDDSNKHHSLDEDPKINALIQRGSLGSRISSLVGFGPPFRDQRCSQMVVPMINSSFLARHMSTSIGEGNDKIDYMSDVADVLADEAVEAVASQAPAVSEVAVAAADSYFPVAALQYLIDGVHSFAGLNWWASIAVTTLLIRGITVPMMINQLKATSKLTLMRPRLEEIKQEMQDRGMSPTAVAEGQQRMSQIFKEYGVTPWTPLKGLLIQGPVFVSFFLAIENMVEKVPSFQRGGAFWFTDLTTPDSFYILPALTALTFWITVEVPHFFFIVFSQINIFVSFQILSGDGIKGFNILLRVTFFILNSQVQNCLPFYISFYREELDGCQFRSQSLVPDEIHQLWSKN